MAVEIYSDAGVEDPEGTPRVVNEMSIVQSVNNLFTIGRQDRLFRFTGLVFDDLLFQLLVVDPANEQSLDFLVRSTISQQLSRDPRVTVSPSGIEVRPDPENRSVDISVRFDVKGLDTQSFVRSFRYQPVAEAWRRA